MSPIAVLGSGSWGTALAVHLARGGHAVRLWGRDARLVDEMCTDARQPAYLPGVRLPPGVVPESSMREALAGAAFVVAAVPSHGLRDVLRAAAPLLGRGRRPRQRDEGTRGGLAADACRR